MSLSDVNLKSFLIPLEEINRATENFSQRRRIGGGGFGTVYEGQLSQGWQNRTAAIKRLGRDSYQGEREFRNEVEMISRFSHENIISFIGYCDQGDEMIIVYEYATKGSLDQHLQDPQKMCCITWTQRLKICIGAARGLNYLHSGLGEQSRVIHRDVKSANILLDDNLVAKVCDFGLSKSGPKDLPNTEIFTNVAGTQFYLDPSYQESHILRKESDVYSFGVVLLEMLSGMLVYNARRTEGDRPEFLMSLVRRYDHTVVDKLIDPHIRDEIDYHSFDTFIKVAYQCISHNLTERPTMDQVVERIEEALSIQENVGTLMKCFNENMGFSNGKPVAAFTIFKCLLHWKYLEGGRTSVVDRLTEIIILAIQYQGNNDLMAYWLSNVSTLILLIENGTQFDDATSVLEPQPANLLFQRITKAFLSCLPCFKDTLSKTLDKADAMVEAINAMANEIEELSDRYNAMLENEDEDAPKTKLLQDKPNSPALLYKQQLTVYVEKLYSIICDNLKKELGSLPAFCFQVSTSGESSCHDSQVSHWQHIVNCLTTLLNTLKENYVPLIIVQKIFAQVFSYINVQLFNSLLSRPECCTFGNSEYVKAGLATLEIWCFQTKEEYAGSSWDELKHIRQAIRLLTSHRKQRTSYKEITNEICPSLSIHQLYRICTLLSPPISQNVISSMRMLVTEDSNDANSISFLLDDDLSIPVFVNDLSSSMQVNDFANVKPAQELAKFPAFHFLYN